MALTTSSRKKILFVQSPNVHAKLLHSTEFLAQQYDLLHYTLTDKIEFIKYLGEHRGHNIVAIYGGFPAFHSIGGLTRDIVESDAFPRDTLRCIVLCSRGYNGIDLEALSQYDIQLYNYQDADDPVIAADFQLDFQLDLVGNDVADCTLWHVLEGFRKFSYQQEILREEGNTLDTRAIIAEYDNVKRFAFGHRLSKTLISQSPRGKKCLILGLGSIGKQIGLKLQNALGLQVHYSKRSESQEIKQELGWEFHQFGKDLLKKETLYQFQVIVVALPGNEQTFHLINKEFLSHCHTEELILVNIGRGTIVDMDVITDLIENKKLRHFGTDVFHNEPIVEDLIRENKLLVTATPHIASATDDVFSQACELALYNIINATSDNADVFTSCSRVI